MEAPRGFHPLPADWAEQSCSGRHGKSLLGALTQLEQPKTVACAPGTITAARDGQRTGPLGFI